MRTLYLGGAGNAEGVRLATVINGARKRWDRLVILDDDPAKHGQKILQIPIAGPFELLAEADCGLDEVVNLVARTTRRRHAALRRIQGYGVRIAPLIAPSVDVNGVIFTEDITVYSGATFCAGAVVDEACVVFTGAVVGHGCRLARCCVLAPGAVINARVELGEGVYVGSNASVLPDLKIGAWATIGANSAVVQDVPPGATVVGVPAQIMVASSGRAPKCPNESTPSSGRGGGSPPPDGEATTSLLSAALKRLREAQREFINREREKDSC